MKFKRYLAAHKESAWEDNYIHYAELKKLLHRILEEGAPVYVPTALSLTVAQQPGDAHKTPQEEFFSQLEADIQRINDFTTRAAGDLRAQLRDVLAGLAGGHLAAATATGSPPGASTGSLRVVPSSGGGGGGGGGGGSGAGCGAGGAGFDLSDAATRQHWLAAARTLGEEYLRLEKYVNLNYTGLQKILKKHDKLIPTAPCWNFYKLHINRQPWVRGEHHDIQVSLSRIFSRLHSAAVAAAAASPAVPYASAASIVAAASAATTGVARSVGGGAAGAGAGAGAGVHHIEYVKSTFWVRSEDVAQVKHVLMQHLTVQPPPTNGASAAAPSGSAALWAECDAAARDLVNTMFLDNPSLELYHNLLYGRPHASTLHLRWYGSHLPETVDIIRQVHREGWRPEECSEDSFPIQETRVADFLNGRWTWADARELMMPEEGPGEAHRRHRHRRNCSSSDHHHHLHQHQHQVHLHQQHAQLHLAQHPQKQQQHPQQPSQLQQEEQQPGYQRGSDSSSSHSSHPHHPHPQHRTGSQAARDHLTRSPPAPRTRGSSGSPQKGSSGGGAPHPQPHHGGQHARVSDDPARLAKEYQLFKTFTEVARLVESKGLQPMVQIRFRQTTFREPSDELGLLAVLEEDVQMLLEYAYDTSTRLSHGMWRQEHPADAIEFPYAVFKVSRPEPADDEVPGWMQQLMASGLLRPMDDFSKFVHACAGLLPDMVRAVPQWIDDEAVQKSLYANVVANEDLQALLLAGHNVVAELDEGTLERTAASLLSAGTGAGPAAASAATSASAGPASTTSASFRSKPSAATAPHPHPHPSRPPSQSQPQKSHLQQWSWLRGSGVGGGAGGSCSSAAASAAGGGGSAGPSRTASAQHPAGGSGDGDGDGGGSGLLDANDSPLLPLLHMDAVQRSGSSRLAAAAAAAGGLAAKVQAGWQAKLLQRQALQGRAYQPQLIFLDPTQFLRNERIFLLWMQTAIAVGGIATGMLGFAASAYTDPYERPTIHISETTAFVLLVMAIAMAAYGLFTFAWRSTLFYELHPGRFDDTAGALAMTATVTLALFGLLICNMADLMEVLGDGPGGDSDDGGGGGGGGAGGGEGGGAAGAVGVGVVGAVAGAWLGRSGGSGWGVQ